MPRNFIPSRLLDLLESLPFGLPAFRIRPCRAYAQESTSLTGPMVITQDTTFQSKVCSFVDKGGKGVIVIGADNITVDGNGLTLDGKEGRGYGIVLNGHKGVTITNFNITGYHYAIKIENAERVIQKNNVLWNNVTGEERVYDINRPLSSSYGGGILLSRTRNSTFESNMGYGQNVGIDMYESGHNTIHGNNLSNCLGWGIRLYGCSFNTLSSNRADHVGGQSTGAYAHRDTAGILLVQGYRRNSAGAGLPRQYYRGQQRY